MAFRKPGSAIGQLSQAVSPAGGGGGVGVGAIQMVETPMPPSDDWLLADGSVHAIGDYPALAKAIGAIPNQDFLRTVEPFGYAVGLTTATGLPIPGNCVRTQAGTLIWAAYGDKIWRSTNNGETWHHRWASYQAGNTASTYTTPHTVGTYRDMIWAIGRYESASLDEGNSWQNIGSAGGAQGQIYGAGDYLFTTSDFLDDRRVRARLYSAALGSSWSILNSPVPSKHELILACEFAGFIWLVFANSSNPVWRMPVGGDAISGWIYPDHNVRVHPDFYGGYPLGAAVFKGRLVIALANGIWSTADGVNWEKATLRMPDFDGQLYPVYEIATALNRMMNAGDRLIVEYSGNSGYSTNPYHVRFMSADGINWHYYATKTPSMSYLPVVRNGPIYEDDGSSWYPNTANVYLGLGKQVAGRSYDPETHFALPDHRVSAGIFSYIKAK
ncbi:tail fiber protein [Pararhizobium haloflavum]|uniref:tail fiber protein n=1 Tax=Pararhizobium haloflavum TaxID=2037914 RepID=UPI000C1A1CC1|nr:tail fiber protein [Pararhizobium haloflavum]